MKKSCRYIFRLTVFVPVFLILGCSSVTMDRPLPPASDAAGREFFAGAWMVDEQILMIQFANDGVAKVAGLTWKDDVFRLERAELVLSGGDGLDLVSVRVEEDGEWSEDYFFARYELTEGGDLALTLPSVDFFDEVISAGLLQGAVERSDYGRKIRVSAEPEDFLAFLHRQDSALMFDAEDRMVLKRVSKGGF